MTDDQLAAPVAAEAVAKLDCGALVQVVLVERRQEEIEIFDVTARPPVSERCITAIEFARRVQIRR